MHLADIHPALAKMSSHPAVSDARAITYVATYPSMRALGSAPGAISADRFNQLVVLAYGWMPRVARIDLRHMPSALIELNAAKLATVPPAAISSLVRCLRSVVGASKVLHFVNHEVFPIWDSRIETFRLQGVPPYSHMKDLWNYQRYVRDVHSLRADSGFAAFYKGFQAAMNARLAVLGIPAYAISEVRAIEAAAFELS